MTTPTNDVREQVRARHAAAAYAVAISAQPSVAVTSPSAHR
jgi:hypothetical protein